MADYLTVSSEPSFSEVLGAVTENDPAHPDTWNPQYHALLENDHWLRAAILATQGQVEDILGSDPINLSDRLDALVEYGAQRVFVERREQVPELTVVSAVGGDDSIDLETSEGIEVGQHYFINDAGNVQIVRVAEILSGQRITLTTTLTSTVASGSKLSRLAPEDYLSPELEDMERGAYLHAQGEGLSARYWTGSAWQNLTQRADGSWDIPSNITRVRVTGTVSRVAIITALPIGVTRRPENITPAEGATGVTATPTLTGGAYYPLYGVPQEMRRFWVFEAGGDAPIYEADEAPVGDTPIVAHTVDTPIDIGAEHEWQYQDRNVEGEWGQRSPRTRFSTANTYVEAPSVTSPLAGATDVPEQPIIELSAFSVVNGTDTHVATSLRIKDDSGAVVWLLDRSTQLDNIDVPEGILQPGERNYTIEPRHHGQTFGDSAWGSAITITTAASFTPDFEAEVGAPFGGGYVAGKIVSDYDSQTYGLIVSDGGGDSAQQGDGTMNWRTSRTSVSVTEGVPPMTLADGRANQNAILALNSLTSFPAFKWIEDNCNAGAGLNGHNDWYLPSRDELELIYRNFKPTTQDNSTSTRTTSGFGGDGAVFGTNASSVPAGAGYTLSAPSQTAQASFQESGADAVTTSSNYWTSTERDASTAWYQSFYNGSQYNITKDNSYHVRAVRRIAL